jgi:hypothetical protein
MSYTTEGSSKESKEDYAKKLEEIQKEHGEGKYNRTLFIGLGG